MERRPEIGHDTWDMVLESFRVTRDDLVILPQTYMTPPSPTDSVPPRASEHPPHHHGGKPASESTVNSKHGGYRHALLKTQDTRLPLAEKDSPAPPMLTQADSAFSKEQDSEKGREPSHQAAASSPLQNPSKPPADSSSPEAGSIDTTRRAGIACLDPALHLPDTHDTVYHSGLVSGADFCDAGIETDDDRPIGTPESQKSLSSEARDSFKAGRICRTLTGGDSREAVVDVSGHIHGSHPAILKVRPATEPILHNTTHRGHGAVSKVRPADLGVREDAQHYGHLPNDIFQSTATTEKIGLSHSATTSTQEAPTCTGQSMLCLKPPSLTPHQGLQTTQDSSSSATSYWGFSSSREQGQTATNTPPEKYESSPARKEGSLPWSTESIVAQTLPREPSDLETRGEDRRTSTGGTPHTIERTSQENDPRQVGRPFLLQSLDLKRASEWVGEHLKTKKTHAARFTQLPEKLHPRHADHDHGDIPEPEPKDTATRVTTFSAEDAVDAGAMRQAVDNLEQLLAEAIDIANDAADPEQGGHLDDSHPQHCSRPEEPTVDPRIACRPPSVHESPFGGPSDDNEHDIASRIKPPIFVGAVSASSHGCEKLSRGSIQHHNLGTLERNAAGLTPPDRCSSLWKPKPKPTGKRKRSIPAMKLPSPSLPSPSLPMPPPDYRLRRPGRLAPAGGYGEDEPAQIRTSRAPNEVPNSREVREYIRVFHQPPVTSRCSSRSLRKDALSARTPRGTASEKRGTQRRETEVCSFDGGTSDDEIDLGTVVASAGDANEPHAKTGVTTNGHVRSAYDLHSTGGSIRQTVARRAREVRDISLRGRSHVSIRDACFSLAKSRRRQPIARDWSPMRKRFTAAVACTSTALIGILVGIYAGLVPSIQYFIADTNHYAILGNVGLYLGMALPTFLFWPLPLLHGRKPYILSSMALAMPLLFPQALAVGTPRSPESSVWRLTLLLSRALMGCALGFASMNFHSILTDLFGASLLSTKPHGEVVDHYDVRRHGGGLGVWLGIWTWCFIGSLSVGFLVGALVINSLQPSWGLYISILLIAAVLVLNVLTPEVRRSAWRRSVAEVRTGPQVSHRVARGEIMMHRVKDGPRWWGHEVYHGAALSLEMLRQPGFAIMATYMAWIYAQAVLIILVSAASPFWSCLVWPRQALTRVICPAPWLLDIQVLPLHVPSGRGRRVFSRHGRLRSSALPKGQHLLASEVQAGPVLQHNGHRPDSMDVTSWPQSDIHRHPPHGGGHVRHFFVWAACPRGVSLSLRGPDWVPVVPCHGRVQRAVDGNVGLFGPPTWHDGPPQKSDERETAHQLLVFPPGHGGICRCAQFGFRLRGGRNRHRRHGPTKPGPEGRHGCGRVDPVYAHTPAAWCSCSLPARSHRTRFQKQRDGSMDGRAEAQQRAPRVGCSSSQGPGATGLGWHPGGRRGLETPCHRQPPGKDEVLERAGARRPDALERDTQEEPTHRPGGPPQPTDSRASIQRAWAERHRCS